MNFIQKFILIILIQFTSFICSKPYPVAIFHGIGDACHYKGVAALTNLIQTALNTEVKCIEIGNGFFTSWFTRFKTQAEEACNKINSDPVFNGDFSILGISQGGLIGRYIIQNCEMKGIVKRFVTVDTPHMGIGGLPKITCPYLCPWINKVVADVIYDQSIVNRIAPAGYYKDKLAFDKYLKFSDFLADLNNEREIKNESYKERFMKLEKAYFVKNKQDSVVIPLESAWFEFFNLNATEVTPLRESDFYLKDYIGLKFLDESKIAEFVEWEGDHTSFSLKDIEDYIIPIFSYNNTDALLINTGN